MLHKQFPASGGSGVSAWTTVAESCVGWGTRPASGTTTKPPSPAPRSVPLIVSSTSAVQLHRVWGGGFDTDETKVNPPPSKGLLRMAPLFTTSMYSVGPASVMPAQRVEVTV